MWTPDYTNGKLVFESGYTIPNWTVRQVDIGFAAILLSVPTGDNPGTWRLDVPVPRSERSRTITIPLQVGFHAGTTGTHTATLAAGMYDNVAALLALADPTVADTNGLQTLTWTPYPGATTVVFDAHVMPLAVTDARHGRGLFADLTIVVPAPATLAVP